MATFGRTTTGGSYYNSANDRFYGALYTLPEDGTVTSMSCYIEEDGGGTKKFQMAIYDTSYNLKGKTVESGAIPAEPEFVTLEMTTPVFLEAGDYYLVWWSDTSSSVYSYWEGSTYTKIYEIDLTYASWPNTVDTPSIDENSYGTKIYATYTAGGGSTATNVSYMIFES